eukprot:1143875-Pelagomonas_calceolata.AAC.4
MLKSTICGPSPFISKRNMLPLGRLIICRQQVVAACMSHTPSAQRFAISADLRARDPYETPEMPEPPLDPGHQTPDSQEPPLRRPKPMEEMPHPPTTPLGALAALLLCLCPTADELAGAAHHAFLLGPIEWEKLTAVENKRWRRPGYMVDHPPDPHGSLLRLSPASTLNRAGYLEDLFYCMQPACAQLSIAQLPPALPELAGRSISYPASSLCFTAAATASLPVLESSTFWRLEPDQHFLYLNYGQHMLAPSETNPLAMGRTFPEPPQPPSPHPKIPLHWQVSHLSQCVPHPLKRSTFLGSFTAYIAVLPFTKPFSISSHWDSAILTQELPPEAPAPDVVPSPISNPRHPPGPDYIPPPHMPPDIEPPHVRPGTFPDIPSGPDMVRSRNLGVVICAFAIQRPLIEKDDLWHKRLCSKGPWEVAPWKKMEMIIGALLAASEKGCFRTILSAFEKLPQGPDVPDIPPTPADTPPGFPPGDLPGDDLPGAKIN